MADEDLDDEQFVDIIDNPTPLTTADQMTAQQRAKLIDEAAEQEIRMRRVAYQRCFILGTPTPDDVQLVMLDLAHFCRAFTSTFGEDDREARQLDGRREVFLRIMDFTKLDYDQLMQKYHRR